MGFTDLLSSSRGPGVIGTLIALFVLVGFGTLYMFVFDEGLQGGQKKIEAVIRDQGALIETHKIQIANNKERIEAANRLNEVSKEADALKLRSESGVKRLAELNEAKAAAEAGVVSAEEAWAKYRDEYRASEWEAAIGEELGDITTVSGRTYQKVKIRKVEHTGIQITDTTGPKSIDSAELPPELQDRFQFDEEIKQGVIRKRNEGEKLLGDNVAITNLMQKIESKQTLVAGLEDQVAKANAAIQQATANESRFQAAITNKRSQIAAEKTKKLSKAPQMEEELRALERQAEQSLKSIPANQAKVRDATLEISTLKNEIDGMNAEIEKIRTELKAKPPEAP